MNVVMTVVLVVVYRLLAWSALVIRPSTPAPAAGVDTKMCKEEEERRKGRRGGGRIEEG
jgi:hypothetical protein